MKIFLFISLIPFLLHAQYTTNDSVLVRTTFTREFNPNIISQYLFSTSQEKVKAALLSLSSSGDTSFVEQIIKLDYVIYKDEICFTLGQIGKCEQSENFLLTKLNSNLTTSPLLQALGKCGSKKSFRLIADKYSRSEQNFSGVSLAFFYFSSRELMEKDKALPVLLNELRNKSFSKERQADAAFTIYRANLASDYKDVILPELKNELANFSNSESALNKIYYLLGSLRSIKFFPDDIELFYALLSLQDHIIKVEAAKSLCYYNFKNQRELDSYLRFVNDDNLNISRSAAASIKELNLDAQLKEYLEAWLKKQIKNSKLSENTRGELFLSYYVQSNYELKNLTAEFSDYIQAKYFYQAASQNISDYSLDYLLNNFETESNKNRLIILQSLLNFQNEFSGNKKLNTVLIESIKSDFAPMAAVAADGVDSFFIASGKDILPGLITAQLKQNINNADFSEAIISLANLLEKSAGSLSDEIINLLQQSELFAVKSYISDKINDESEVYKDSRLFPSLWENAFKYSSAEIETSRGKFTIKFFPEFAPISVGNFSYLSSKKFFDEVIFHRVVPAFVIQAGDPAQTGWGGPGYEIVTEGSYLIYNKGMVGMASAGKDTEGSQWFVTSGYYPHLNGRYSIFAEVISGMEIIYRIDQDDIIQSVKLIQ